MPALHFFPSRGIHRTNATKRLPWDSTSNLCLILNTKRLLHLVNYCRLKSSSINKSYLLTGGKPTNNWSIHCFNTSVFNGSRSV
ncbi:unnamed protein product [Heterobilharzia americana]|nr:unnamed protein product [Heterobilharzia americana]